MLLHMYVIFTSCYCFLSKCAQYDPGCRWALKHYSFIHSSFANAFNLDPSKSLSFGKELSLFNTILTIIDPKKEAFENIVGKGENAGNQHFSVLQTILVLFMIMLLSVKYFNSDWSKILLFSKEFTLYQMTKF